MAETRGPKPGSPQAKNGGQAVMDKYGLHFYAEIGKLGGELLKQEKGSEFYAQIGKQGGEATNARTARSSSPKFKQA